MALHAIQDTNCAARVIPTHSGRVHPDRVIAAAPQGCESPARPVRFARALQRENQTPYAFGAQPHVSEIDRSRIVRGTDSVELSERAKLLPKLGEMAPIMPDPTASTRIVTTHQQHNPATGRVLDLYV